VAFGVVGHEEFRTFFGAGGYGKSELCCQHHCRIGNTAGEFGFNEHFSSPFVTID
jgi:hypothetical protein